MDEIKFRTRLQLAKHKKVSPSTAVSVVLLINNEHVKGITVGHDLLRVIPDNAICVVHHSFAIY